MVERWFRKARTFILEQRKESLEKANRRFPDSTEFPRRYSELENIEKELKQLKE